MKKVAIIGTQGVPASYGGFETLVENIIGTHRSDDVEYTVYCSSKDMPQKLKEHKGAKLKYIALRANGAQSVLYDIIAMLRSLCGYDTILVLGVSGCIFLPILRLLSRAKIIVNIDGLEHRRNKWTAHIRKYLLFSEVIAVKFAHVLIADNKGIVDYVKQRYKKEAEFIAYGGDHVLRPATKGREEEILKSYNLERGKYAISVCRIEPENNCHITLDAFSRSDKHLLFIGNWKKNEYGRRLSEQYKESKNITLLDSLYDLEILHTLRTNAAMYIHGHSAGGTNPSLVEAMFFGRPILAYNVVYNCETTHHKAYYWNNSDELLELINKNGLDGEATKETAYRHYTWERITREYEGLY